MHIRCRSIHSVYTVERVVASRVLPDDVAAALLVLHAALVVRILLALLDLLIALLLAMPALLALRRGCLYVSTSFFSLLLFDTIDARSTQPFFKLLQGTAVAMHDGVGVPFEPV